MAALFAVLLFAVSSSFCAPAPAVSPARFDAKATFGQYFSSLPDDWGEIAPADLDNRMQTRPPFIVDTREPGEVAAVGFIAGSVNIPIRSLMKSLDRLPLRDQPIVVVCATGNRSALGMEALQLAGYTDVRSLAGGFAAWKAANLTVSTGAPADAKAGRAPEVDKNLLAALDKYLSSLSATWNTIPPATVRDLIATSRPFQLDVREATEVADAGSIEGATHIPIRTLVANLDKLPPDKGELIVAESVNDHRSAMAMLALDLLGYRNVRSLMGGLAAWTKARLPVSSPGS